MEEEVTDNHMSGQGIPHFIAHHLPKLGWPIRTEDVTAQNPPLIKIRFYNKFKNSKQLQATLKSDATQIHQVSVLHGMNQRIIFARLQFSCNF